MKKAYNENWIKNLYIQQVCGAWLDKNLITSAQFEDVKKSFPESFYRPGIFVKIGLFLFTLLAGCFFSGFISLFLMDGGNDKSFALLSILCAACFFFALEYFIKDRRLFHSGIDNALLYMGVAAAVIPLFLLFERLSVWQYCFLMLIIHSVAVLRYADLFLCAVALFTAYLLLGSLLAGFPLGKAMLPFVMMIFSALVYFLNKPKRSIYYRGCQVVVKVVALLGFYSGGNYYVVREGNAMLADQLLPVAPQIPFAGLFYLFTLVIPLLYCWLGLKTKDRTLLIMGLLTTAFSCFTYRYYFDFLPIELVITLAGAAMIFLAVFCMHYFKTPKYGLSDEMPEKRNLANLEAMLIAHHLGQTPAGKSMEFGGGDFGGGGAGNDY